MYTYYRIPGNDKPTEELHANLERVHLVLEKRCNEHADHLINENNEFMKQMRENFLRTGSIYD